MSILLTAGALQQMHDCTMGQNSEKTLLQLLVIKKITSAADKPDRHRLHLSEGVNKQPSATFAT